MIILCYDETGELIEIYQTDKEWNEALIRELICRHAGEHPGTQEYIEKAIAEGQFYNSAITSNAWGSPKCLTTYHVYNGEIVSI